MRFRADYSAGSSEHLDAFAYINGGDVASIPAGGEPYEPLVSRLLLVDRIQRGRPRHAVGCGSLEKQHQPAADPAAFQTAMRLGRLTGLIGVCDPQGELILFDLVA